MGVDLEQLEQRIRELSDREAIKEVLHNYMDCSDRYDFDRMVEACFHEDAVFIVGHGGDPVPVQPFFEWSKSPQAPAAGFIQAMHYLMNVMIKLNGDEALVQSHMLVQHLISKDAPDLPFFPNLGEDYGLLGGARYVDLFERRDGRWAISRRELQMEWDARIDPSKARGLLSATERPIASEFQDYEPKARP